MDSIITNNEIISRWILSIEQSKGAPELAEENALRQLQIEQTKPILIDYENRLTNLINNLDVPNFLIRLKDGSHFIINMDILYYMANKNYIPFQLVEKIVDQPLEPSDLEGNAVILNLIDITRNNLPIILTDICLTRRDLEEVRLADYLLNENMLKTLLLTYINNYSRMVNFNISLVYKSSTLLPSDIRRTLQLCLDKVDCAFMFVIKIDNKIIGWILEPLRKDTDINMKELNVRLFFRIIDDVLYIFQPPTSSHYYFSINSERVLSIVENKQDALPLLYSYDDKIIFNPDPNFDNKTLDNNETSHTTNLNELQIYEIGGINVAVLQQMIEQKSNTTSKALREPYTQPVLRTFNYTAETIKKTYEQITGIKTKKQITEKEECRLKKYCPTYHPYLCHKESEFRNKYSKDASGTLTNNGPSNGNGAPCVSEERFCAMNYEVAKLQMIGKSNISRTFSSKPIYCKTDQDTGNKQMIDTTEGGKYSKNKYRTSKMKIQKKSKNSKGLKIQKRSKNTKGMKIQKRSKKNYYF